jgi:hypothetical protein
MLYRDFSINYDELAKDYFISIVPGIALSERFGCLSYVYNFIDQLYLLGEL